MFRQSSVTAVDLRTLRPADLGAPAPMGGGAAPDTSPGGALGPTRDLGAPVDHLVAPRPERKTIHDHAREVQREAMRSQEAR